ncbi:MAG: 4'-phosphopantetheinyl transferase superfamily protein [Legionella sp.]|jgi:4'-phosphopantetheinyl transferase
MILTGFQPLDTQNCILDASRIDLWQFSLRHEIPNAEQILNESERIRGHRFYFERHQRRFMTARATMRIILAKYLKTTPEQLEFTYNAHGKPEVINQQNVHFNISHSQDLAILAVGTDAPMGVDLEYFSARPYEGIAKTMFSEQEYAALLLVPKTLQAATFFHVWAQKEAFIKACGLGLAYPTQNFTVPTTIPTKQLIDDPLHDMTWQMRSFMPEVACSGALCYHPRVKELRHNVFAL